MWKFTHLTVTKCGLIGFLPLVRLNIGILLSVLCIVHLLPYWLSSNKRVVLRILASAVQKQCLPYRALPPCRCAELTGSDILFILGNLYSRK